MGGLAQARWSESDRNTGQRPEQDPVETWVWSTVDNSRVLVMF